MLQKLDRHNIILRHYKLLTLILKTIGDSIMWTKPEYSDMRFGFEVTMYICNR